VATANLPVTRHEPRGEGCVQDVISINKTSFPLGDSGLRAEVKLTRNRRERVGLEVHVIGQAEVRCCISLYRGDGLELWRV